jgi:hypothetical protein
VPPHHSFSILSSSSRIACTTASERSMWIVLCLAPSSARLAAGDRAGQRRVKVAIAVCHLAQRFPGHEQPHAGIDALRGGGDQRHVGQISAALELAG